MTLICCSIRIESHVEVPEAIAGAVSARDLGAHMVEWRVDSIAEEQEGVEAVRRLVAESPVPCILTCRSSREGGSYNGTEADRVAFLEAVGTSDQLPKYIDFELADYIGSANVRQKIDLVVDHRKQVRDVSTGLILSMHDFEQRPAGLMQGVESMASEPSCAVMKVAWHARSIRDNLEAFDLLRERSKPMIALCMGDFGGMSRILAPKFEGFLTFASLVAEDATAPGQLTVQDLREIYRFDAISPSTRVYGVVGWPVRASLSPVVHNAGFEAVGHDGVYVGMPVPPEWEHFKATLGAFLDHDSLDLAGLSVTMPHKEHLVRFVRESGGSLDATSERCGAANTLVIEDDGSLRALNTDAPAAVAALAHAMEIPVEGLAGKRVALLGAGGVARAIATGLLEQGASVTVINRTASRAESLVRDLQSDHVVTGDRDCLRSEHFDCLVNATSVGSPAGDAPEDSPLPDDVPLGESVAILETVYANEPTPLVRRARQEGAKVATGEEMFIRQAILQFEAWTGTTPPDGLYAERLRLNQG